MRNSRNDNPDDFDLMADRLSRRLVWGLTKGVIMLVAAVAVTYGVAMYLQHQARNSAQEAAAQRTDTDARRDIVPLQGGRAPDGRQIADPGAPLPAASPGPNPTQGR